MVDVGDPLAAARGIWTGGQRRGVFRPRGRGLSPAPLLLLVAAAVGMLIPHSVVALEQRAAATPATPAVGATKSAAVATPVLSSDPVVAAVQQVSALCSQAASAAAEATELAERGDTMPRARRHMLLVASQLFNASDLLKRVGQKEKQLAERGRNMGEQKQRIAPTVESEEERTTVTRQAREHLAYAALQSGMADSMLALVDELQLLAKEAEAASSPVEVKVLAALSKKISGSKKKSEKLVEEVRTTRARLEKMPR